MRQDDARPTATPEQQTTQASHRWWLLLTVTAGLWLITLDNTVLYTALPTLSRVLDANASEGLWIINAYPLVMTGLLLGSGTLGDRYGHRRMFLLGLVVFGLASLLAAFSPTSGILIAARALLAIGAAAMMPATLALIRITFTDERERNLAIALWGSVALIGGALGPIIGGLLLERFWWGAVFLLNVPIVLLAFAATLLIAPADSPDPRRQWDGLSSILALLTLSALVLFIKESLHPGSSWWLSLTTLLTTLLAGILFVLRQSRLPYPLLDFSLFRNRSLLSGVVGAAVALFAFAGIQLLVSQRFQLTAGYSPVQAGLLVSVLALGALPMAILGGAWLHRLGLRPFISGGMMLTALACLLIARGPLHGLQWVIAGLVLSGMGLGAIMAVASSAILDHAPVHRAGMAASVEEVSYEFGSLIAVALLGSLMTEYYSSRLILPTGVPVTASESMLAAKKLASELGAEGEMLLQAASHAFDQGFSSVMNVTAGVLFCSALLTTLLLHKNAK